MGSKRAKEGFPEEAIFNLLSSGGRGDNQARRKRTVFQTEGIVCVRPGGERKSGNRDSEPETKRRRQGEMETDRNREKKEHHAFKKLKKINSRLSARE